MAVASPIDSASSWLWWSNIVYISGAVLTLAAAMHVRHEKRAVDAGQRSRVSFASEASVILAAIVSLAGTAGAIYFSDKVGHLKDLDLSSYQTAASVQIAQANKDAEQAKTDAAIANQKAQEAHDKAVTVEAENLKLGGQVGADAVRARSAEASLEAKNKETSDFAHSLQQQQGVMAEQAKVSPQLTSYQIQSLASFLKPYAGQDVSLHITAETVVGRLAAAVKAAFNGAGITTTYFSTDMGALYQGVSVAVHAPNDVPPLANALILGFRQAGIDAHPVAAPQLVAAGKVSVIMGPN